MRGAGYFAGWHPFCNGLGMSNFGVPVKLTYASRCALAGSLVLGAIGIAGASDFSAIVVRVRAIAAGGAVRVGSGVVTGPGQVATACHVTRGVATIEIEYGGVRSVADAQVGSQYHDLCLLSARTINAPVARTRRSEDLSPGEAVVAIGFQGGEHAVEASGRVAGLYLYDDGPVIRTTAAFDFGSSGGGLFDQAGNLVGILAFKARTGDNLRFALPTEWLLSSNRVAGEFVSVIPTSNVGAFWELSKADRPSFLGVARREAEGKASGEN